MPFTIFEKNTDVGGTWLENSYPGCRVDIQNHMYSYSFAQKHDWPYYRGDLVAVGRGSQLWHVTTRSGDGTEHTVSANVLVSAVGQLNRPKFPDIAGRASFAGPAFRSAGWDHSVDLAGKKVAVIGTGASACQFVPTVGTQAGVAQRACCRLPRLTGITHRPSTR